MRTREARFFVAAALLHTTIPVLARIAPEPMRVMVARSSKASEEIFVELDPEALRRPTDQRPEQPPEAMARAEVRERERREARRAVDPQAPVEEAPAEQPAEGPVEPAPPPAPAPAPTDEYGGPPPAEPITAPGLGGTPVWTIPGVLPPQGPPPPAPTAAPARADTPTDKAGQLLRQAMGAKDKALGLDLPAAGTVATAVAEAVRASDTPHTARATFEVRLSGSGQVLGARMVSATAGASELWARVASAAMARLSGKALTMTAAFAKGARVYVSVVSSVRMPSGAASSGPKMQGAGFGFDLSDIGAHATRVVSSSFKVVAVE